MNLFRRVRPWFLAAWILVGLTAHRVAAAAAPVFTTHPANQTAGAGATATFTVVATGDPAPTFQWQLSTTWGTSWSDLANTASYSGVNSGTLVIAGLTASQDTHMFRCRVSNSEQVNVASLGGRLTVVSGLPQITTQPADVVSALNGAASFAVVATGTSLKYQWFFNSALLSGATNAVLNLSGLKATDGGNYYVTVSNTAGAVASRRATLAGSAAPPTITAPPADHVVTSGQPVTFSVTASGAAPLAYQWRRNGFPISAATSASFTLPVATRIDADRYDVVVASGLSTAISPMARLAVAPTSYPGFVAPDPAWAIQPEYSSGAAGLAIAGLADGRFYTAGHFSSIGGGRRTGIARFLANGLLDPSFAPPEIDGEVRSLVVQADGKLVMGGDFMRVGGNFRRRLARLSGDGSLDPTFDPGAGANDSVRALAIQSDGRVLVAGNFTRYGDASSSCLARVNADGRLDPTFLTQGFDSAVHALAIQSDGKILVAGQYAGHRDVHGALTPRPYLSRLHADGSLDAAFQPVLNATVYALAIHPSDQKILAGGAFKIANGVAAGALVRLNPDGSSDSSFATAGTGFDGTVYTIACRPNGQILVGGFFDSYDTSNTAKSFARLNANGSFDTGFLTKGFGAPVHAIQVQSTGEILVAGVFSHYQSSSGAATLRVGFARLQADGALDSAVNFSARSTVRIYGIVPLPGEGVLVTGYFNWLRGAAVPFGVARIKGDGSLDSAFSSGGLGASSHVYAAARQPDGKIVLTGVFTTFGGGAANRIVRLHANSQLDSAFAATLGLSSSGLTATILPGGRIFVGGMFTSAGGARRNGVAILQADGTADPTFDPGIGPSSTVYCSVVQPDGKIIIGGAFGSYNGTSVGRLARLHPDGTLDLTFASLFDISSTVGTLALQSDGRLLVGGSFTAYGGTARSGLVRLLPNGAVDPDFVPPPLGILSSLLLQEDGRIVVRGMFESVDGASPFLARLNADGTRDPTFAAGGFDLSGGFPTGIAMRDNGQLIVQSSGTAGLIATRPAAVPVVVTAPVSRTVATGGTATLTVGATSLLPLSYQWRLYDTPIAGAVLPTLTIPDFRSAQSGIYSVVVSNELGSAPVVAALLSAGPQATILAQPIPASVDPGSTATFAVVANGTPAPAFQWQRRVFGSIDFEDLSDPDDISGSNSATLEIANVTSAQRGDQFRCIVSNGIGSPVISTPVTLTINGPPMIASPAAAKFIVGRPGRFAVAATGSPVATFRISAGALPAWATLDASTGVISGTPPDGNSAPATFTLTADNGRPPPATQTFTLTVQSGHSADVAPADGTLNLTELTRVIELYNTHTGTVRTGRYITSAGTVDGYAPDPSVTAGPIPTTPHTADLNRDGRLSLTELTRVIELFNTRAGTTRTGAYHIAATPTSSEDGFAPGP